MKTSKSDNHLLPGAELVEQGLKDLERNEITEASLLVMVASPRLKALGITLPERDFPKPFEHELYSRLEERLGNGAHSHYNGLIRQIVSYAHALERERSKH